MLTELRIVLLGAPGVGKGTQAKRLKAEFGWAHISTGDMLRDAMRTGTELGDRVRNYVEKGDLVTDDLMVELVGRRLQEDDCQRGFILDGFPRTVTQAEKLDGFLNAHQMSLDGVVSIDVPKEEIIQRLSRRLTCPSCGLMLDADDPKIENGKCPQCGTKMVRRPDDEPETIRHRLDVYESSTRSLIKYYEGRKLLKPVDGTGSADEVYQRILEALGPGVETQ